MTTYHPKKSLKAWRPLGEADCIGERCRRQPHRADSVTGIAWPTGVAEVDAVAAHRDLFLLQSFELRGAHGDGAVGSDHPVPRNVLGRGREHVPDESWRTRVDVAVRLDEAFGDRPDTVQDPRGARVGLRGAPAS